MYTSSLLKVKHGFFTRKGGISEGLFDSLNFAITKGDDRSNVMENRTRALRHLGLQDKKLLTLNQVHGNEIVIATSGWDFDNGNTPSVDAIITSNRDFVIGILTADCVPILLFDKDTNTVAAVHAGWKGTYFGIINSTINGLKDIGVRPENLKAAIGPCISQDDYEVGEEVYQQFIANDETFLSFFKPSIKAKHYLVDLSGIVQQQLKALGVRQIDNLGLNTYSKEEDFFSCRRAYHRKEPTFGCMLSAISLEPIL